MAPSKKAIANYEIYKKEHPNDEHKDLKEYDDDVWYWFKDSTSFPNCRHCRGYYGDEIITRGYFCKYCSSEFETVYICRNCSWDDCPKKRD